MMTRYTGGTDVYDATPDFCYAVSLFAAIEGATGSAGHYEALPFVGMGRAELVDFGQRRPAGFVDINVNDVRAGLRELEGYLTALMAGSEVLQHTLRLEAARGYVRRGIHATS